MSLVKEAVENINADFKQFKDTYDELLREEKKGNEARARELSEQLERIESSLQDQEKAKKAAERQLAIQAEQIDMLEAINNRPKKTVEEKLESEYHDAFVDFIRSGMKDREAEQKMRDLRVKAQGTKAVSLGVAADGGHGLPEEISRSIDKLILRMSDVLNEIKMVQVGSSDYKELISYNPRGATWVAETGTRSTTNTPNIRQITPTWGELYAYMEATQWSLEDIFFNVETWLQENAAEDFMKALDAAVWSGDGSNKPTGMINTTPVTTADTDSPLRAATAYQYIPTNTNSPQSINFDDVYDLLYSLNRGYRPNAKFGANTTTHGALRKLKDNDGQYLWQPSNQAGEPARLAGFPLFTFEDMADATTADGFYLGFGDWRKAYTLCYRTQLAITIDNNITTPGYVKYYIRRRFGGIVANNDALKFLRLADT